MTAHLRYLKYVLLHKFYVLRAGLAIAEHVGIPVGMTRWVWRLLVHDLSKFSRAEWSAYVAKFYRPSATPETVLAQIEDADIKRHGFVNGTVEARREMAHSLSISYNADRQRSFNAAWLHHIHANPHHWQYHVLLEDSGKTIVLVPPAVDVHEMVADWLAAGSKALRAHSMGEAVAETIVWYASHHRSMQMREKARERAEFILAELAAHYGVTAAAQSIASAQRARMSITIPGR